ncbi:MAG: PRC-barrel domain-containing protein [Actinobacteria bacterium]|nr:PRC-barrel domain-containing protein [Actinomycetota bacterium]
MRQLSETVGTKVMSSASAQRVGTVQRALTDVPPRRIVALQVGRDELVDWEAIVGVGPDAVVIEDERRVRAAADAREERALAGELDWKGKRVLSDLGDELGTVTEVEFDEADGSLHAVDTTTGPVAAERLHALGSYCLVVRHSAGDGNLPQQ